MKNKVIAFFFGPGRAEKAEFGQEEVEMGPPFKAAPEPPLYASAGYEASSLEMPDDLVDAMIEDHFSYRTRQVQDLSQGPFIWETNDHEKLKLSDMATPHLFYTLRMIYNHSVPPAFRVGDFKRRANVDQWPLAYRLQAGHEIRKELNKRKDYEQWMRVEVKDMRSNADFLDMLNSISGKPQPIITIDDLLRNYNIEDAVASTKLHQAMADTSAQDVIDRRRDKAKEKRMKRAAKTNLHGFPGVRCMEHRSYAGIRKPRVDCKACRQVHRARKIHRKEASH